MSKINILSDSLHGDRNLVLRNPRYSSGKFHQWFSKLPSNWNKDSEQTAPYLHRVT